MFQPIVKAIEITGGVSALAKHVDVAPPAINQWKNKTRPVSPKKAVLIEKITKGKVTRQHLRPNDWAEIWPELQ